MFKSYWTSAWRMLVRHRIDLAVRLDTKGLEQELQRLTGVPTTVLCTGRHSSLPAL
jgi:hypothetical protein